MSARTKELSEDGPLPCHLLLGNHCHKATAKYGEWSKEVDSLIGQLAEIASAVPERLGCCHGPAQAQGQYAQWARKHLHRESLREVSRCRHAALDRLLLRPTETYAGDPDHCRMIGDSPNDPGVANAWDSSDARGAYEDRPPRAA